MGLLDGFKQGIAVHLKGEGNLSAKMDEAGASVSAFSKQAKNLGKVGGVLFGVGTAMTGFAALTVGSTIRTKAALGEMASLGFRDLETLERAAADFSNQFAGTSKSDFIAAAYDIRSGVASLSEEGVARFTQLAAMTGKATKSTTAEMTSLFATAYGIYKGYYSDLSDIEFGEMFSGGLSAAAQAFKTTGPAMSRAMERLGASATSALIPLEEQLSVLGMLQATMPGAEAGTKYKAFLKSVGKAGETLGLQFTDAAGNMLPMANILEVLRGRFGEVLNVAEKTELQQAFGTEEAVMVIDLLYNNVGALRDNIGGMSAAMQNGTSLTRQMANSMNQDLGAALSLSSQRVSNFLQVLGNALLPMITPIVTGFNSIVLRLQKMAEASPALTKIGMGAFFAGGAVIALTGAAMMATAGIGALSGSLAGSGGIMAAFTASMGVGTGAVAAFGAALWTAISPILPIIAAIAAVVGIFVAIWKTNLLGIQDAWAVAVPAIKAGFGIIVENIKILWGWVKQGIGWIISLFGDWGTKLYETFKKWNAGFEGAQSPLRALVIKAAYLLGFMHGTFRRFLEWLPGFFKARMQLTFEFWSGIWNGMLNVVKTVFNGIWTFMLPFVNRFIESINRIGAAISTLTGINLPQLPSLSFDTSEGGFGKIGVESNSPILGDSIAAASGSGSTSVDRSVQGNTVQVSVANGDRENVKQGVLEAFEELAGQSDEQGDIALQVG